MSYQANLVGMKVGDCTVLEYVRSHHKPWNIYGVDLVCVGVYHLPYRYCQPPSDFTDWFEPYFDDDEVS